MPVIPRPATATHETPAAAFTSLATPSNGAAPVAVWEVCLRPGHPPAEHRVTHGEVFVPLTGRAIAHLDDSVVPVGAGDVLVVPPDTPFALVADGVDFRALCVMPVEGRAVLPGGTPFTPPWAE